MISVAILTYNRKLVLKSLLEELQTIYSPLVEVIVVDNCSGDGTMEMVSCTFPWVIYHRMEENIGVGARNEGFRIARGDIIITLDDDILNLSIADIVALEEYFSSHLQVGALNFKVVEPVTKAVCNWVHHREVETHHNKEFITYEITEGAVAFRKEALSQSGYYPETFFLSHEGPDLAFRLLNCGYEVRYADLVTVTHFHSNLGRKAWYRYYYDTRNQFLLSIRHFPVLYATKFLTVGVLSTLFYSFRDGFASYWWRGILDGIKFSMTMAGSQRQVLSDKTMAIVKQIDKERPSLWYMLKKRMFRKEMRL